MMKRIILTAAAALVWSVAGGPAGAQLSPPQQLSDIYVITLYGKIFRVPGGTGVPQELVDLRSADATFEGEWIGFDPATSPTYPTGQFVAGPGANGTHYRYVPTDFSSAGSAIAASRSADNLFTLGTFGGIVDVSTPALNGKSDLLLAEANPDALGAGIGNGIVRIKGDGTRSLAAAVGPQGFNCPADVDVNNANGDLFVVASFCDQFTYVPITPGAVVWYTRNPSNPSLPLQVWKETIPLPNGDSAMTVAFDNHDLIPTYELAVAGQNGSVKRLYLIDLDKPQSDPTRFKLLGTVPLSDASRDDVVIGPTGEIVYSNGVQGKVFRINSTTGAVLGSADVPGAESAVFMSRNALASSDTGLALGQFLRVTGPTGKAGLQVTVTDPEFSSGLIQIMVTGNNLVAYDKGVPKSLPHYFYFDPRHEITKFVFVCEKINNYAGANVTVEAHDAQGLCGDPPVELLVSTRGNPGPAVMDLTEVPPINTNRRVVTIDNAGINKITLEIGGETYKLDGDAKMGSSTTAVDIVGKKNTIKIPLNGSITLLVKMGNELTCTVAGNGQSVGNDAMIAVN